MICSSRECSQYTTVLENVEKESSLVRKTVHLSDSSSIYDLQLVIYVIICSEESLKSTFYGQVTDLFSQCKFTPVNIVLSQNDFKMLILIWGSSTFTPESK